MIKSAMVRLSPDLIKSRFCLDATEPAPAPGLLPAGVLVPLFFADGEPQMLLTQRTWNLKDHRGQIAFPGGVRDPEDPHLLATAIRETQEEIGLNPEAVEVLGSLEPVSTVTGYWINPYPALIPYPYKFTPNRREVKRLIFVRLEEFLDPPRWSTRLYEFKGQRVWVCYFQYGKTLIWGATARIILEFLTRLGENPLEGGQDATCLD
jgi:8-oxo-dGTP pyrophosphatase MutT (NUDIX family)